MIYNEDFKQEEMWRNLKKITANEIIQTEYGLHDMEAETKATENRAEIAFIVGVIKGMNNVQNTLRKRFK